MNSIGVDFKLKSMTLDGKNIKLQIVRIKIYITSQKKKFYSGTQQDKKDLEQ